MKVKRVKELADIEIDNVMRRVVYDTLMVESKILITLRKAQRDLIIKSKKEIKR